MSQPIKRIALFGGSFNPFHNGHFHALRFLSENLSVDEIRILPNEQSPFKESSDYADAKDRVQMISLGLSDLDTARVKFEIDLQEIKRGGTSFTIDSVEQLLREKSNVEISVVIGADQFDRFDEWKRFEDITRVANLVVLSRRGFHFPSSIDEFPSGLRSLVHSFDGKFATLTSEKTIEFLSIPEVPISSSQVRRQFRSGRLTNQLISIKIEQYIKSQKIYESFLSAIPDFEQFTRFCAKDLSDRKALGVKAFDLRGLEAMSDFSIVSSGTSTRHASALAENLYIQIKEEYGVRPQAREGIAEGRWIVLDYGLLVVHVFYDFVRQEYRLEELWKGAKELSL